MSNSLKELQALWWPRLQASYAVPDQVAQNRVARAFMEACRKLEAEQAEARIAADAAASRAANAARMRESRARQRALR